MKKSLSRGNTIDIKKMTIIDKLTNLRSNKQMWWFGRHRLISLCAALSLAALSMIAIQYFVPIERSDSQKRIQRILQLNQKTDRSMWNDIHVPADMWRDPSQFPSWNPEPLPDCCTSYDKKGTAARSPKFDSPGCDVYTDFLRYYGPGMDNSPKDLQTALRHAGGDLVIVGDSVSQQWFESLACYLGAFDGWNGFAKPPVELSRGSFESDVTESFFRFRPEYRVNGNLHTSNRPFSNFGSFKIPKLTNEDRTQRVILHKTNSVPHPERWDMFTYYDQQYPQDFRRERRPIFVFSFGLQNNAGDERKFKEMNEMYMNKCRDSGARCIFAEVPPQHFVTPDGDGSYLKNTWQACMSEPPASFSTLNRWRQDTLREMVGDMEETKGGGFIRVMDIYEKLSGLHDKHHPFRKKVPDCTHWRMNAEIWEPWQISLTEALKDAVSSVTE